MSIASSARRASSRPVPHLPHRLVQAAPPDPIRCPICGSAEPFSSGKTTGWHSHVGPLHKHPEWHPDVTDAEARRVLFVNEHGDWLQEHSRSRSVRAKYGRAASPAAPAPAPAPSAVVAAPAAPPTVVVPPIAPALVTCPCCHGRGQVEGLVYAGFTKLLDLLSGAR